MLPKSNQLSFTFFDAGGGDAIWIRFLGNDCQWHNILIDGGFGFNYKRIFGPLIKHIVSAEEMIDAWIITHIDRDHIGSVLAFTRDKKIIAANDAVKAFWFNHSELKIKETNGKLSVTDGIEFRTFLKKNGLLTKEAIMATRPPIDLYGLQITILSPTPEKLNAASDLWKLEEKSGKLGRTASQADHGKKIEELRQRTYVGEDDPVNASSIACLFTFKGTAALLLADSQPDVVAASLMNLGFSRSSPLILDFIQLAHHGSKANTSPGLLHMVQSSRYVITGNGITNQHPDKETLVRILTREDRQNGHLEFIFPSQTRRLSGLFGVDTDPYQRYDFSCRFGEMHEGAITLSFIPFPTIAHE